jgi:small conductance mechanosensitive channel
VLILLATRDLGERFDELLNGSLPVLVVGPLVVLALYVAQRVLARSTRVHHDAKFRYQLIMAALTGIGLLAVMFALPIDPSLRSELLSLIGLLMSAAIALSSTSLLGNAMAGVMLRIVKNFNYGDFVRVGEHFGRVSERGLFHTEIQTEDRDLTTLPNLYLIANPVTVVRPSGTILSATVSLGYDAARKDVDRELCAAGLDAGLEDPFVQVIELGDFAVTYRVAGLLKQVNQLVSARSRLRKRMLDHLHGAGIEIVSPTFMNTLARRPGKSVLPVGRDAGGDDEAQPEALIFDKAEEAAAIERLRRESAGCAASLSAAQVERDKAATPEEKTRLVAEVARLEQLASELAAKIESAKAAQLAGGDDQASA